MLQRVLLLTLLAVASPHVAGAQRLPTGAVPLHYQITFRPNLATERFEGEEAIDIRVDEPTSSLTLNAVDLDIRDAAIVAAGRTLRPEITPDAAQDQVRFSVTRRLTGVVKLRLKFSGALNRELRGLYLSQANGRKYAVTQFEATDARRAFPCFDEPAFKASFAISATVNAGDTVISNGRVLSDTPGPGVGKHTVRFTTTRKMPSYLVALAVGDFDCLGGSSSNIPIRVCATPDKKDLRRFALDAAEHFLAYYNSYFTTPYPFRKLDLVAIPDFSAGAMENTAAIFFREQALLVGPGAPRATQREVAATIAHEMAHQWFGDLVTMKWWDDLWLNEGFATWMETKPILGWKPEWRVELDEVRSASEAMAVDGLASTRPIRAPLTKPAEIDEAFDAIAYDKGAAVLRMVESQVGAETFRAGVNAYLRRYAYGNATAPDFWTEIAAASGKPVDRIIPTFVDQPGVPLVTMRARCEGGERTLTAIAQERFLLAAPAGGGPASRWTIPLALRGLDAKGAEASAIVPVLLEAPVQDASIPGCAAVVLANAGARGYYRTAYAPEVIARLAGSGADRLTGSERLRVLDDEWALVKKGAHDIGTYLALVEGFANDPAPQVLDEIAGDLEFAHDYMTTDQTRASFETWVRRVFGPLAAAPAASEATPAPGEDEDRRERRAIVMRILGRSGGDPDVMARARTLTQAGLVGGDVDAALLPAAARLAARTADHRLYALMEAAAVKSGSPSTQEVMLDALTQLARTDLLDRALTLAASDRVRNQDTAILLGQLLGNPAANREAWRFITSRWGQLEEKMAGLLATPTLVAAASSFCDASSRDEVKRFFQDKVPQARRTLDQTLERIDNCIALRVRETPALARWLAEKR